MNQQDIVIEKIETLLKSGTEHNIKLAILMADSQKIDYDFYRFSELAFFISEYTRFDPHSPIDAYIPIEQTIKKLMGYRWFELEQRGINKLPDSFGLFLNLKNLHLESNYLSDLPKSFVNLIELQKLHLQMNPLVNFPKVICNLKNLEQLSLHTTQISQIPAEIAQLKKLSKLDLRQNPISATELNKIKSLLPNTEITF